MDIQAVIKVKKSNGYVVCTASKVNGQTIWYKRYGDAPFSMFLEDLLESERFHDLPFIEDRYDFGGSDYWKFKFHEEDLKAPTVRECIEDGTI